MRLLLPLQSPFQLIGFSYYYTGDACPHFLSNNFPFLSLLSENAKKKTR